MPEKINMQAPNGRGNANHPAPGRVIRVEPIRDLGKIAQIKKMLAPQVRNLAVFTLGINSNLRAIDMLGLKVGDVAHLREGDELVLREKKTGKVRIIPLNGVVHKALHAWLAVHPHRDRRDAPLFLSRQGGRALTVSALNRLVKSWCRTVGLKENFGCHTLRKTFGFMHRKAFGTDLPTLLLLFNHSSQRQTLTYLGIQPEEVRDAYMKEL
jgi:integrase